jgi:hypothetical protein
MFTLNAHNGTRLLVPISGSNQQENGSPTRCWERVCSEDGLSGRGIVPCWVQDGYLGSSAVSPIKELLGRGPCATKTSDSRRSCFPPLFLPLTSGRWKCQPDVPLRNGQSRTEETSASASYSKKNMAADELTNFATLWPQPYRRARQERHLDEAVCYSRKTCTRAARQALDRLASPLGDVFFGVYQGFHSPPLASYTFFRKHLGVSI